jgi:two-component system nitrogen regulation response regulator GlnG
MESDLYAEAHRQVDRILLARTLEETDGNQLRAARWLGIGRETLRRKIREVGIHLNHWVEADAED